MRSARLPILAVVGVMSLLLAACGDDDTSATGGERPTVVVTTSILGDVVEVVAGDQVDVETIMPTGADPHSFQASAQQANEIREADALIVNGAGFEEGLLDVIDAAGDDGTPTFEAISAVEPVDADEDHADEEEEEDGHEGHDHEGLDPHFFTDPSRMAASVDAMAEFLVTNVDGIDADALGASADAYIAELEALDAEVEGLLAEVPEDQRVLVTNHEVFGYLADRYDFEVIGTVIPAGSTADGASAQQLAALAEVIEREGVPAIFADASSTEQLAETLADEVGEIEVVELFSESLGDEDSGGATYLEMVRTNAERIAEALTA